MNEENITASPDFDRLDQEEEDHISAVLTIMDSVSRAPVFIDDLPDAVVDGVCLIEVGSYVVVEKWLTIAQKTRWLGTSLYRVGMVKDNGDLSLHDEDLCQTAQANWKTGPKHGWRFKLASPSFSFSGRDKPDFQPKAPKKVHVPGEPVEKKERKKRNSSPEAQAAKKAKQDALLKRRAERLARREARKAAKGV